MIELEWDEKSEMNYWIEIIELYIFLVLYIIMYDTLII